MSFAAGCALVGKPPPAAFEPNMQLARLELKIALPALLRRFPDLRLAVPEADLRFRVNSSVYALRALPITW